jgi:acetolactate decarboxylase
MWHRVSVAAFLAAAVAGVGAPIASAAVDDPWVHQIGTYDYLVSPNYSGLAPINSASKGTTLGLGTFDHLDGELIMVGGESYRVGTDGTPVIIERTQTTPFFESVKFAPTASGPVPPGTTCANLIAGVNALARSDTGIIAVRVRGTFSDLTLRSVPAQTVPYPPLSQVVAQQTLFPLGQRRAVLVGFRTGPDLAGTGAPGLHLHGLTADRKAGGHVISCVAGGDVQLSVQRTAGVRIEGAAP